MMWQLTAVTAVLLQAQQATVSFLDKTQLKTEKKYRKAIRQHGSIENIV